jgi:2-oxoisovalerate dehydrogenase E1 component
MATVSTLLAIYRAMLMARLIDQQEAALVNQGHAFFHVSGAGHEAMAALAPHLTQHDWLHCHYRDKALLLMRGLPIISFFTALLCRAESPSGGRQMSAHLCDPSHNVLSMVGPVGNNALQAAGVAAAIRDDAGSPIVLCALGDGTTQQGEVLEACAETVRSRLPVLFVIEDNEWAISTPTKGKTFFSRPDGVAGEFYGVAVERIDGRDAALAYEQFETIIGRMRVTRGPAFVHFAVKRLSDHTNGDDQAVYRDGKEIESAWADSDPVRILERRLMERGLTTAELQKTQIEASNAVQQAAEAALHCHEPEPAYTAKVPLVRAVSESGCEYRGNGSEPKLTMRDAIRSVLAEHLQRDPRVCLYGEDIEDPKGDVFGITQGLSSRFPGRVINSPLSESTIVGTCVGRALAGARPVAFLQFADFIPLAFNQIASEMGSIFWRTNGQMQCSMIVMVSCGGYRPGLGPFHAQSLEALITHTPGIDVFMPSTAGDAAGLLNAAFLSGRPTLFFYPKALLNADDGRTSTDVDRQLVPIGKARIVRAGRDITLVGWGNTVPPCARAARTLEESGVHAEVIDLRSLSPWDEDAVLRSVQKTGRLVVVHEDNRTCGMGAEIVATVSEKSPRPIRCKRVARPDTFVPCNFANQLQVLPSFRSTLTAAAELLDLDLTWEAPAPRHNGVLIVEAIGSAPSDAKVRLLKLHVRVGSAIHQGDVLAETEASKATMEMVSPASGVVAEIFAAEGAELAVGEPLLGIRTQDGMISTLRNGQPDARPRLSSYQKAVEKIVRNGRVGSRKRIEEPVAIVSVAGAVGSRIVTNEELLAFHPKRTAAEIVQLTGIESRRWVNDNEDVVTLAVQASRSVLEQAGLSLAAVDMIVASTLSPRTLSPSLSCRLLAELAPDDGVQIPAYDINAACAGYLYGLQSAYDFLQRRPSGRVLVVTSEVMSARLDCHDFDTAFLFGDAATATLLVGEAHLRSATARLFAPELFAKRDVTEALTVPLSTETGFIRMKGGRVFSQAVKSMSCALTSACQRLGICVDQLAWIVPHQANQRILDAVAQRLPRPVFSNIRLLGNTSSSSIPLALSELLPRTNKGDYVGLCSFGGGFAFGGTILKKM